MIRSIVKSSRRPWIAQQIRTARNNMPATRELINLTVDSLRYKYDALISKGFTEEQALRLIMAAAI